MVFVPVVAIQDVNVELPSFFLEALNGKVVDAPTLETPDDSPANDEREDSSGCACAVSVLPSCEEDGVDEETSEAGEREGVEEFAAASPTTTTIAMIAEKNGIPILRGLSGIEKIAEELLIDLNAFNEETAKATDKIEKSTGIFSAMDTVFSSIEEAMDTVFDNIGEETEDAIYTQVNKFNGSASQVVNQTVDELIDAGGDLSLISTALSRTKTANKLQKCAEDGKPTDTSLEMDDTNDMAANHAAHIIASPESLNPLINGDVEYDQESEGEGMEISLANNIGDTRTLAEI